MFVEMREKRIIKIVGYIERKIMDIVSSPQTKDCFFFFYLMELVSKYQSSKKQKRENQNETQEYSQKVF